ncbi:hypothetical protein CSW70_26425, partial [Shigella sonnei]
GRWVYEPRRDWPGVSPILMPAFAVQTIWPALDEVRRRALGVRAEKRLAGCITDFDAGVRSSNDMARAR